MSGRMFLLAALHFFTAMLSGQQEVMDTRILFRGVVISASTNERLAGTRIIINRKSRTSSGPDGTFSFYALKRDTILFTSLGYKPGVLIVSDTLRTREFLAGIYLQSDTIDIGEVIIIPRLRNLKAEMMNPGIEQNVRIQNAVSNISIAAYVGRTSQPKLGDPHTNYDILRNKQRVAAYEKGGIPSDQMVGLSPFLLFPAACLLIHGLPETPHAPPPSISKRELDELNQLFLKKLRGK